MKLVDSDDYRRKTETPVLGKSTFTQAEALELFEEMVRAEAANGRLGKSRRKRLIQYAAALQLTPLQASRIVTKVTRETPEVSLSDPPLLYKVVEQAARPHKYPLWIRLSLILAVAVACGHVARHLFL